MKILSKMDIQKSFTMKDAIEADKRALSIYSNGDSNIPLRTNIDVGEKNGQSLFMPGYARDNSSYLGIKIVSVYPDNIIQGLPSVPATMINIDSKTGIVNAILDGTYLTQLRTGAVQGAATDILARQDAKIGALIGTGGQGETQAEAMINVRELEEVRVFDIDFERANKFAGLMNERFVDQFSTKFIACKTTKETLSNADIITTVTTSKKATFSAEEVKKGAHINGVGAYTPEMCEVPKEIIKQADVVIFDTMDGVLSEAGDFISPLESNYISKNKYNGELGEIINGKITGRTSDKQITIFKTVGTAVLDVVVSDMIVKSAFEKKLGTDYYFE